ncbi:MAG TPA: YbaB/EbfC family nucleoid-associated protein [Planctomycetota bacterium]|nr:YbaB/EbfC family nucleoid-associated protein [Planctomycetota bacterium]
MFGLKGMGDMMKLFGQRDKIMENIEQAKLRARGRTVIGEAGAGMVKVTANGLGDIVAVNFDPEALKDPESLSTYIVAASNIALLKSKEIMSDEFRTAFGGIELPPGMIQ